MYIRFVHKSREEGLSEQRKAEPWWYGLCQNKGHPPTWAAPRPWARPRTAVPREAPALPDPPGSPGCGYTMGSLQQPGGHARSGQSCCVCAVGCVTATRVPPVPQEARAQTCQAPPSSTPTSLRFPFGGFAFQTSKRKNYVPYSTFPPHQLIWLLNFQWSAAQLNPSLLVTNRHIYINMHRKYHLPAKKFFSIMNFQKDEDVCSHYKINYNLLPFFKLYYEKWS